MALLWQSKWGLRGRACLLFLFLEAGLTFGLLKRHNQTERAQLGAASSLKPTAINLFSFIHLINKCVLSAYGGQDIVLGLGNDSE